MNSKASRNELQWPPLLNMSNNRPQIHSNFQSAERNNAPFVNEMLTPHYKKEVKTEYKTTFDKYDNKYDIHDGALYKNDEKLFDVNNRKFVQEDVTNEFKKYSAFDYDDEGNIATLVQNADLSFDIEYKDVKQHIAPLFVTGQILASRVRCLGTRPITVIVYLDGNTQKVLIFDGTKVSYNNNIVWCFQTAKSQWNNASYKGNRTVTDVAPLIQICQPLDDTLAISIASNYSEQLNTRAQGFFTFVEQLSTGKYLCGIDWQARSFFFPARVEVVVIDSFLFSHTSSISRKSYQMYRNDEDVWIDVNTRQPVEPAEGLEPEYTGETIPIDGVNQPIYTASYNTVNYTFDCTKNTQSNHNYKFYLKVEADEDYEETIDFNSQGTAEIKTTRTGWGISEGSLTLTPKIIDASDGNKEYPIDSSGTLTISQTTTSENEYAGWVIAPNFFLDSGDMFAWWQAYSWEQSYGSDNWGQPNWVPVEQRIAFPGYIVGGPAVQVVVERGRLTAVNYDGKSYDFSPEDWHNVYAWSTITRNNCISVGQNFWSSFAMFNSMGMKNPNQLYANGLQETGYSQSNKFISYTESNAFTNTGNGLIYYSGSFCNSDVKWSSLAPAQSVDCQWYNVGGFRVNASRGGWNILYYSSNDTVSDIQGLSWSEDKDQMGTLIAPWNKVDSSFYIVFTEDFMIYRNTEGRTIKVSIEEGNDLRSEFNNTFIIVNTTSYWNCYDVENDKRFHYASDYNDRVRWGWPRQNFGGSSSYNVWVSNSPKQFTTSINAAFNTSKDSVTSLQSPVISRSWFDGGQFATNYNIFQSNGPLDASDIQPIELYMQKGSICRYYQSILPKATPTRFRDNELVNVEYTGTATNYTPDIFATYINGAGNNDFIKEGKSAYPIAFNNFGRPIFVFTVTGEALDVEAFFVIQGQYYAVMNEKIYALSYMNGYIQNQDAVIDVRGMKFVGNTPEIAFFWSEKKKAFYSYTGDGILQQIFDATKYSLEMFSFKYYYDETVQSIWIPTTAGLLCFGAKNTYLMEDIVDVENIIFTENYTYIVHKNGYTILTYFYEDDFEPVPIELETSFYGVGNNEVSTIDRWQITLYDERHPKVDVKLSVRSITDVTVKAEEKVFHIGESDWDKWSHSILLSYSPKLIKGQGIRLYIETPVAIQKIVPHVADQGYANTTKFQM